MTAQNAPVKKRPRFRKWLLSGILASAAAVAALTLLRQPVQKKVTEVLSNARDRQSQIEIYTGDNPKYEIIEQGESGELLVDIDRYNGAALKVPDDAGFEIAIETLPEKTRFRIQVPYRFRAESWYSAISRKLSIQCEPLASASQDSNHYQLALAALARQDTAEATRHLQITLRDQPSHAEARLHMGMLQLRSGSYAEARFNFMFRQRRPELQLIAADYLAQVDMLRPREIAESDSTSAAEADSAATTVAAVPTPAPAQQETQPQPRRLVQKAPPQPVLASETLWTMAGISMAMSILMGGLGFWLTRVLRRRRQDENQRKRAGRIFQMLVNNRLYRRKRNEEPEAVEDARAPRTERGRQPADGNARRRNVGSDDRAAGQTLTLSDWQTREAEAPAPRPQAPPQQGSMRDRVLALAERGYSIREIAEELQIGIGEVELVVGFGRTARARGTNQEAEQPSRRLDFTV